MIATSMEILIYVFEWVGNPWEPTLPALPIIPANHHSKFHPSNPISLIFNLQFIPQNPFNSLFKI